MNKTRDVGAEVRGSRMKRCRSRGNPGIQRSSDQKMFFRRTSRGLEKEFLQSRLTIGGVGPGIGKVGVIVSIRSHGFVNLGIDAAIERRDTTPLRDAAVIRPVPSLRRNSPGRKAPVR